MTKKYNEMFHESSSWKKLKHFDLITITPDLAQDLLKLNTENRPVKSNVLERYTADLKAGKFHFTGETIKISREGKLLDGQHRLLAVIATGLPMKTNLQAGLDPAIFTVLDTGSTRSIADVLALKNYKYYNNISGAAKLIHIITSGNSFGSLTSKHIRGNDAQLALVQTLDKDLLEDSCRISIESKRCKFIDQSLIIAFVYILSTRGRLKEAETFLHLLSTGDGLGSTANSSIWLLRNRLIENLTSSTKLTLEAKYFLLVSCWNVFLKGRSMKRLPKVTEELPELLS